MILLLFFQIEWQTINRPIDDFFQELVIYYWIPYTSLRPMNDGEAYYVEYETQLKVFDNKNNQVAGDFWEKKWEEDTLDISDSVKLTIPTTGDHFELKIYDLHAGNIAYITDRVLTVNYLGDIRWEIKDDTLRVGFFVFNNRNDADSLKARIDKIEVGKTMSPGTYEDIIYLGINTLPNNTYTLRITVFSKGKKIDEVPVNITIARVFYLDDAEWGRKTSQLEYIASYSEMNKLKDAEKSHRDSLWSEFWKQHDPTPHTGYNEKEIEYFKRIDYCEKQFSHGDLGWRSDRARVYVKLGPPDEIQSYPYYNPPKDPYDPVPPLYDSYIVWFYYKISRQFVFGDKYGLGQYTLLNPGGLTQ